MASLLFLRTLIYARVEQEARRKQIFRKRTSQKQVNQSALCRICNKAKADIPIFDYKEVNIPQEITHISGVIILKQDSFSKHICESCIQLLKGCIIFREMCQNTNKALTEQSIKNEFKSSADKQTIGIHEEEDILHPVASAEFSNENTHRAFYPAFNKGFAQKNFYNRHIKKYKSQTAACKKSERHLCEICGKTTQTHRNLIIHMNIHNNIFPFKCDVCPYQGRSLDLLKVHKRTHLTDKPFKCQYCPKSTSTASNLNRHIQSVHSNNRPFKCTFCATGFSNKSYMIKHMKRTHFKQPVNCNLCLKTFASKKGMRYHQFKIHKVKALSYRRMPAYLQAQEESITLQTNV